MGVTKQEDDLVDAGSELSFPASDPPSYMGGVLVVGPPHGGPTREPASHELAVPDGEASQASDPAQAGDAPPPVPTAR